jgi:predicted nucleic acid-binding protein
MKPTMYHETTFISYLTAWPSNDVVRLGHQVQTREWWDTRRQRYELVCSEVVEREAAAGDATAAEERLKIIRTLPLLAISPDARSLADQLVSVVRLPRRAYTDALHVAIAATNGVDYLLTWNCRHLTDGTFRPRIEQVCRDNGFQPPSICTPPDLLEPAP